MNSSARRFAASAGIVVTVLFLTLLAYGTKSLAATGPVAIGGTRPADVAISGHRVVWADRTFGNYDIFLYDGSTGETARLTAEAADQIQPAISGTWVVWVDYRGDDADIWVHDLLTGVSGPLVETNNDQLNPSISGTWVAWEDHVNGYNPRIAAIDIAAPSSGPYTVASGYGEPMYRPVVSGDLVVWEDHSAQSEGRADADIRGALLSSMVTGPKVYFDIARGSGVDEIQPWTDGRYVVYARRGVSGTDVWAWDRQSGESRALAAKKGEQANAVVSDGRAYWLENGSGKRLYYGTHDFSRGRTSTLMDYGVSDVVGLRASGRNTAWLVPSGRSWQVRANLIDQPVAFAREAARGLPASVAWTPRWLARAVAGEDDTPPEVVGSSVEPGETGVAADAPLVVYFSERMDAASLEGEGVRLIDDGTGLEVPTNAVYSPLAEGVRLEPEVPLDGESYTLAVSGEVSDSSGNALGEDVLISFSRFVWFAADTAKPSMAHVRDARPLGLGEVEITWARATDNVGVVGYRVYRYAVPINATNRASAELVATVLGAATVTTQVPVAADERALRKYTLYYAVTAYDAANNESDPGNQRAPDPHGTYIPFARVVNCSICHAVHGTTSGRAGLGAKSAEACYECHGTTPATGAYGYGSTLDTQYDFFEDAGDPDGPTALRHRNAYMMATQAECDACHTSHRRPANVDVLGSKEASTSHSTLTRRPADPSITATDPSIAYVYNTDATPLDQAFCVSCHGTESIYMTSWAGATAYSDAGGDHETGYSAAAHGPSIVLTSTRAADDPGPLIQCYACHNEHATQTQGFADWRQSGSRDGTYDQAGLCFACHSASTAETRVAAGYAAPFAWNDRDVEAEFAKEAGGGSAHAIVATGGPEPSQLTCANCHNTHVVGGVAGDPADPAAWWDMDRASNPANTKNRWAGTAEAFCISCHDADGGPTMQRSATVVVPYSVGFADHSGSPFFPGWDKSGWASSGHGGSTLQNMELGCESCHDPHASDNDRLVALTAFYVGGSEPAGHPRSLRDNSASFGEEGLCFACHGNDRTPDCSTGGCHTSTIDALEVQTAFSAAYSHPVETFSGRHSDLETAGVLADAATRHAECVDCHDPHSATPGTHAQGSSLAGSVLDGAIGVRPSSWPAAWGTVAAWQTELFDGDAGGSYTNSDYEAWLCFKCHSSYANSPTSAIDTSKEFNPANASYHAVVGDSKAAAAASGSYVGGWAYDSHMTCSDCHSYSGAGAEGPHGSAYEWILKWDFDPDTEGTSGGTSFCTQCHDPGANAGTGFSDGSTNLHSSHGEVACTSCHVSTPAHGWKQDHMLGDEAASESPYTDYLGKTGGSASGYSVVTWRAAGAWGISDCFAGCHGDHTANLEGTVDGVPYVVGSNVGCTQTNTTIGCHYPDLRLEHGTTGYSVADYPGYFGAGRDVVRGDQPDGCGVCHTDKGGTTWGPYASTSGSPDVVGQAMGSGDKRCTACHTGAGGEPGAPHADSADFTSGVNSPQLGDWAWTATWGNGVSAHNSYPGMGNPTVTLTGNPFPRTSFTNGGTTYSWPFQTGTFPTDGSKDNPRTGTAWAVGDAVYCTDCHVWPTWSSPAGPQGASTPVIVDPTYSEDWNQPPSGGHTWNNLVCSKCHNSTSPHNNHSGAVGEGGACTDCHTRIPHAWKRPRLLAYVDDAETAYRSGNMTYNKGNPQGIGGLYRFRQASGIYPLTSNSNCIDQNCDGRGGGTGSKHNNSFTAWP